MRTTNMLRISMLAFFTLGMTLEVFIAVEDKVKRNVKIRAKHNPNGHALDMFYYGGYESGCTNGTSFITKNLTGTECGNLPIYPVITNLLFDKDSIDSRHLDISMPGYDLSVRSKTHLDKLTL
jgi:hypothetical protein